MAHQSYRKELERGCWNRPAGWHDSPFAPLTQERLERLIRDLEEQLG